MIKRNVVYNFSPIDNELAMDLRTDYARWKAVSAKFNQVLIVNLLDEYEVRSYKAKFKGDYPVKVLVITDKEVKPVGSGTWMPASWIKRIPVVWNKPYVEQELR